MLVFCHFKLRAYVIWFLKIENLNLRFFPRAQKDDNTPQILPKSVLPLSSFFRRLRKSFVNTPQMEGDLTGGGKITSGLISIFHGWTNAALNYIEEKLGLGKLDAGSVWDKETLYILWKIFQSSRNSETKTVCSTRESECIINKASNWFFFFSFFSLSFLSLSNRIFN